MVLKTQICTISKYVCTKIAKKSYKQTVKVKVQINRQLVSMNKHKGYMTLLERGELYLDIELDRMAVKCNCNPCRNPDLIRQ